RMYGWRQPRLLRDHDQAPTGKLQTGHPDYQDPEPRLGLRRPVLCGTGYQRPAVVGENLGHVAQEVQEGFPQSDDQRFLLRLRTSPLLVSRFRLHDYRELLEGHGAAAHDSAVDEGDRGDPLQPRPDDRRRV